MIHYRCRVNPKAVLFAFATLFTMISLGCGKSSNAAKVDSQTAVEPKETDPKFVVPEGKPEKIVEFIKELGSRKPTSSDQREQIAFMLKTLKARIRAGEMILAQEADDESLQIATVAKLDSTMILAVSQFEQQTDSAAVAKQVLATVERLRQDKRKPVSEIADSFWFPARVLNLSSLTSEEKTQMSVEAIQSVVDSKASDDSVRNAQFLAQQFSALGDSASAASVFDQLSQSLENASDPNIRSRQANFKALADRLKPLQLEGTLLGGGDLDWNSYRGKVVLVDFWATWCKPCVAELPNVKANYEKYHSRGFDVVAISLDTDRKKLERYVASEKLPWVQMFDSSDKSAMGWKHPMAVKYAVSAIPTAFLVDQNGKTISLEARGDELGRHLQKLLGDSK